MFTTSRKVAYLTSERVRRTLRAPAGGRLLATAATSSCVLALATWPATAASLGSATPRCHTAHLRLSYVRGLGAAGTLSWDLSLRNEGSATCHLYGYPGVGLLKRNGHRISVNVDRDRNFRPTTVVVHHGQDAYFTFIWESAGPCEPHSYTAYGLEVFPPNSTSQLFLHRRLEICDKSLGGRPRVTPVRRRLGGL